MFIIYVQVAFNLLFYLLYGIISVVTKIKFYRKYEKGKAMKYLIGKINISPSGSFRITFSNSKCIEANSKEEAIRKFSSKSPNVSNYLVKIIGTVDENNQLIITNFSKKYDSACFIQIVPQGVKNFLVSRLLDEPSQLGDYSLYIPKFVQARTAEEALNIYNMHTLPSKFKTYVLGYADENDTFIVPNISDYIA